MGAPRSTGGSAQPGPGSASARPPLRRGRRLRGAPCKGRAGPGPPRRCAPRANYLLRRKFTPWKYPPRYLGVRRAIENTRKYKFITPLPRRKQELAEICFG